MKLNEAYSVLGISPSATPEEAKKQYRKLTMEFHPDRNKDPGAEDQFKKINEAYQIVSSGKSTDREEQPDFNPFSGFNQDIFSGFNDQFGAGRQQMIHPAEPVTLFTQISFKESILGTKRELKFNRKVKCQDCNGNGKFAISNGCDVCQGKGKVVGRQGNMMFVSTCSKCRGATQSQNCRKCQSKGTLDAESSVSVNIPGGVQNNNILRLSGMGNFVSCFGPIDQYTDAHLHLNVDSDPEMSLDGQNVVSETKISLLEALQGCTKSVNTVLGPKSIDIKPASKNKDEVTIPKSGVNGMGNHRVILNVEYPQQLDQLINYLSN